MDGWGVAMASGYALEFLGLAMAGFGLLRTWRANRLAGARFWDPVADALQRVKGAVHRLIHGDTRVHSGSASGTFGWTSHTEGHAPDLPDLTAAERVAHLEARLAFVEQSLASDRRGQETARREQAAVDADLRAGVEGARKAAHDEPRRLAVEGIWGAVFGLGLALVGLTLQGAATAGTWG